MSFLAPYRLWLLVAVLGLAVAYAVLQRRKPAFAVRFTELELLASVMPRSPSWRRHVPAAVLLLSLVALTAAFARPEADVQVPRERATVIIAIDTSISMQATDVAPSRIAAAKDSAATFVDGLPERFNVGLVSFSGNASIVVAPTKDHFAVASAVRALPLGPSTAIGEAVFASLQAISGVPGEAGQAAPPARIVLLSDGTNTVGRPLAQAAAAAREAGVPVSTIAYGTERGTVEVQGERIPVPVDGPALERFAESTGGSSFAAESGEELAQVYDDIGSQVGTVTERREVTAAVTGAGLGLALLAAVGSLVWGSRLP